MKLHLFLTCAAFIAAPALGQSMNMPGMTMPAPAKPAAKPKAAKHKSVRKNRSEPAPGKRASRAAAPKAPNHAAEHDRHATTAPAPAQLSSGMTMPMPAQPPAGMTMPVPAQPSSGMTMPMPARGSSAAMGNMPMGQPAAGHEQMSMTGVLGSYPMQRDSSGTAWQPDASPPMGLMFMTGDWTLMAHGVVNFVVDHQSGPRGDDKAFASGMLMGMARRPLGRGTLQFRASLSPDPLMGPRGYPLLLASGEIANGRDRLIDRQHPHDFVMELSGSFSQQLSPRSSVFVYAGLPGEPAFGPPAFMHRPSIMDSPEAPITHHWLDSTHISFGVVTAGAVLDRVKVEISRFNAREPDQHRWDIETGPLDSTAIRLSWNPARTLALQGSWGHFKDPEQLEPGVDQTRWSASAMWEDEVAPGWNAAATLAWGRKTVGHHSDDALALEGSLKHDQWTLFGRAETAENRELVQGQDDPAYRVGKVSIGAVRDFRVADHLSIGAGALLSLNFVPVALRPLYGRDHPIGSMAFVRVRLN